MNEEDKRNLIKDVEKSIAWAHRTGSLPKNFSKKIEKLNEYGLAPDKIINQAFLKLETLSTLDYACILHQIKLEDIDLSSYDLSTPQKQAIREYFVGKDYISFTVVGDSMKEIGIEPGDIVIAKSADFENNSICIVKILDDCFIKRVEKLDDGYLLHSENRNYSSVFVSNEIELEILGRVVYVLKKIEN
ncbi:MAG: S24 family peptidase [Ignavibacteria bacterium]|nr:S24 family peptidase [Ignavibacteria bacterium]